MFQVLIVCTGNTCRSPMAETLFRKKVRQCKKEEQIQVASAGVAVFGCSPASGQAQAVMRDQGLDLTGHMSRQVTAEAVAAADLVLTMTSRHKQVLLHMLPEQSGKVFTIAEFAGCPDQDVPDPFGGDYQDYAQCAASLTKIIDRVWGKIAQMAG